MQKIVSIIIPTYNMENYLHQCLDSLILDDQALFEKTEVLIVNDGSKDNSLVMAKEYESRNPAVFRVIDKPNGNYGSCVNRGLSEATGKYVKVLDADDAFYDKAYKEYVSRLMETDADMILTDYNRVDPDYKVIAESRYNLPCYQTLTLDKLNAKKGLEMHGITYRTSVLRDHDYRQTEGISYTDSEWSTIPLMYVKTVQYFPLCLYRYLIGREGQTVNPEVRVKSLWMMRKVFGRLLEVYQTNSHQLGLSQPLMHMRLVKMAVYIYTMALQSREEKAMELIGNFDLFLKQKDMTLYQHLEEIRLDKLLPVKFIRDWRSCPDKKYMYWNVFPLVRSIKSSRVYALLKPKRK